MLLYMPLAGVGSIELALELASNAISGPCPHNSPASAFVIGVLHSNLLTALMAFSRSEYMVPA